MNTINTLGDLALRVQMADRVEVGKKRQPIEALRTYLSSLDKAGKEAFALRARTTLPYLRHLTSGFRRASVDKAELIELASKRRVKLTDLRPDIFRGRRARLVQGVIESLGTER